MYNYTTHCVNCPGCLLVDGERYTCSNQTEVSPRPNEVAKRNNTVQREAGKAYAEDISPCSPFELLL